MEDSHARTPSEVLSYFNVQEEFGLSDGQYEDNKKKYGKNGTYSYFFFFLKI